MPAGTDEEYMGGATASRAAEMIDAAVAEGKTGSDIVSDLATEGMRLYTPEEVEGGEEAPMEEAAPMEAPPMKEGPVTEDAVAGESLADADEGESMPFGGPDEGGGGEEGGARDMRIAAVRFALDKDKEKKAKGDEDYA